MIYKLSSDDITIEWGLTGAERIAQNVLNILRTRKGEVMFMYPLGIDPEYVDGRLDDLRRDIVDEITEQLKAYENRAELVSASVTQAGEDMHIVITVELEVG